MVITMDAKRIATLAKQLATLRTKHAEHEKNLTELERLGSKQAPLLKASRDKVATKIAALERRIANLQADDALEEIFTAPVEESPIDRIVEPLERKRSALERTDKQVVADIIRNAAACDEHAVALCTAVRQLHQDITHLRMKNGGRGPSSALVPSALERAFARHATGTVLRSLRGPVPHARQAGFKEQIQMWMPSLTPPKVAA
jgi:hypothetical protein